MSATNALNVPTRVKVTAEERQQLIATAAYYKAAQRAFEPGLEQSDWLEAEQEIECCLEHRYGGHQMLAQPIAVALFIGGSYGGAGAIQNAALHGVFVETEVSLPTDNYLQVRFKAGTDATAYRFWGRVVHHANSGLGIAIDVLDPGSCAALQAVIDHLESQREVQPVAA